MQSNTLNVQSLLVKGVKKPAGRKSWGIDLETVWIPFFTATNVKGETAIASDSLGCPLRLAYSPDGEVKFSKAGRPIFRVVKELSDTVRMVRDNFTNTLLSYAHTVEANEPELWKAEEERAAKLGEPIKVKDDLSLQRAVTARKAAEMAAAVKEAEGLVAAVPELQPVAS
jgi:hypothetical protein